MPAPVLQVKRGALSNLPGLKAGEPAFTTDSYDFYVGIDSTTNNNKFLGSHRYWSKETASKGSGINLVEATGGTDFITLAAPASVGAAITYTFPGTITDGYFLKTNSSGVLSWGQVVGDFNIAADSGSTDTVSTGSTITFVGGTNVNTAVTDNTITINLDNNISVSGLSTFTQGLVANSVRVGVITNTIDTTAGKLTLNSATGTVEVSNHLDVLGDLDVTGNVYIGGTSVTLRGQDVFIENKDIVLGYTTSITPNDTTANHAGVAIASTVGSPLVSFTASGINTLPDTYKQLMWFKSGTLGFSTDAFAFNYGLAIGTTTMADGVRLAVGTGVTVSDTSVTATTFIGNLTGTATTATRATTVDTTGVATNQNYNLTFTDGSGTAKTVGVDAELLYNPNTNVLSAPNINSGAIRAADGTTAITITNTTGAVGFANSVTISGDLYVLGTTTEVNTSTLKVEDTLVDLGLVNDNGVLVPPTSDLNLDVGILLNWYSGSAKKASVYWDDSARRVGIASDITESSGVLTANAYAAVEIGALWVTDCAGTSQVISCTGSERFLENITVDAGTF